VPALVALTLVATVWVALHAYEIIWWREARANARATRAGRFLKPKTDQAATAARARAVRTAVLSVSMS
jgi:hypothetical protein